MKIGIMAGAGNEPDATLAGLTQLARRAETDGFASFWLANVFGLDAMTAQTVIGVATTRIELGTAVVPIYPRHPTAMAQQALSTALACDGRFTLGIGLSHKLVIEDMFGLDYSKPASHMEEYLQTLIPLLRGESLSHSGERYRIHVQYAPAGGVASCPVLVAALGPRMLRIAARYAAGTVTWMTGLKTLAEHTVPALTAAAQEAGAQGTRVVAGLPVVLTSNVAAVRARLDQSLAIYGQLPSYKAMIEREGSSGPGAVALVGDEKTLREDLRRLREAGVSDLSAAFMEVEPGAFQRTWDFLKGEL